MASRAKLQQTTGQLTQVFVLDLVDEEQPLQEVVGADDVQFEIQDSQYLRLHLDHLRRFEAVVAVGRDDAVQTHVGCLLVLGGDEDDRHQEQIHVLGTHRPHGQVLVHDVHGQEKGLLAHPEDGVRLEDPKDHFGAVQALVGGLSRENILDDEVALFSSLPPLGNAGRCVRSRPRRTAGSPCWPGQRTQGTVGRTPGTPKTV